MNEQYLLGYYAAKGSYRELSAYSNERVDEEDVLDEIQESWMPYIIEQNNS